MDITTENIDEWCFRYLEKDLTGEEIVFFEKELLVNSDLYLELNKWKKTFLTNEDILQDLGNVENVLYRFKHQIALLLAESVLVVGICAGLFVYTNKEMTPPTIIDKPSNSIEYTESRPETPDNNKNVLIVNTSTTHVHEKKSNVISAPNIEPLFSAITYADSIIQSDSIAQPSILKNTVDSTARTDSSQLVKKPKSTTQKNNVKRKRSNGSRLIPINNDL